MALPSRQPPRYSDYEPESNRARTGQTRAPATVHHSAEPSFNNPRQRSADVAAARDVPRSSRDSYYQYHENASSNRSLRANVRYHGQPQPDGDLTRVTSAPQARSSGRDEPSVRFADGDREERRRVYRPRQVDDIDEESHSDVSGRPRLPRDSSDLGHSTTQSSRPPNTNRMSQGSLGSDNEPRNYAHGSGDRHGGTRGREHARHQESSRYQEYDRRDPRDRADHRHAPVEESRSSTARRDDNRHHTTEVRSHGESATHNRDSLSRSATANKRYHEEPASYGRSTSPTPQSRRDSTQTTDRRRSSRVPVISEGARYAHPAPGNSPPYPHPATQPRHQGAGERQSGNPADANPRRGSLNNDHSVDIWKPWEEAPSGRRFRIARFQGKTALIQFDGSSGPYCDGNNNPVERDRALTAIKRMQELIRESSAKDNKPRASAKPASKRVDKQSRHDHDESDSNSNDVQAPRHARERRDGGRHDASHRERRRKDYDSDVDGLEQGMKSSGLNYSSPAPRRGLLLRRTGEDPKDDGELSGGVFGAKGPKDDDDLTGGTFGAKHLRLHSSH